MIKREVYKIDATDQTLGRLCTRIAKILMGKNKPEYRHDADLGDSVEIVNADKVKVTGKKAETMAYYKYSGFPGGMRKRTYKEKIEQNPGFIIEKTVYYMLPKNKLRNSMMKRLKIV